MASSRRARDRAAAQARRLAANIVAARATAGLSRSQAAARAGVARSTWERIEAADPGVALRTMVAATDAVGLDLVCQTYPGAGVSLRDSGQMRLAQTLAAMASSRWQVTLEEPAGDHGEAVDLVLWGSDEVVAVEIERLMLDYQAQARRAALKRDWLAARHSRPVRLVIVIEDTRRNRAAMAPWAALLASAMPLGTRAILGSVRSGAPLGGDGICWIRAPARSKPSAEISG